MLYTVGYSGRTAEEIAAIARHVGATIVDVRYSSRSRLRQLSGAYLRQLLGDSYVHIPAFGNLNYRCGGETRLADPERGLKEIACVMAKGPVVLLCVCRDAQSCHRSDVANVIASRTGASVEHFEGHAGLP